MSYSRFYPAWRDYPDTTTPTKAAFYQGVEDYLATQRPVYDVTSYASPQAAIDAASVVGGGDVLFPLGGTHGITSSLSVTTSGIRLVGEAYGRRGAGVQPQPAGRSVIQWQGSSPAPMVIFKDCQTSGIKMLSLEGGSDQGLGSNAATYGVQALGTDLCKFEDTTIDHLQANGVLSGTQDSVGIWLSGYTPDGGVTNIGSQFNRILYCTINAARMVQLGTSPHVTSVSNTTIGRIDHLTGSFSGDAGIYIYDGDDWTMVHPYCFTTGAGYGLVLDAYARNNVFVHPFFKGGIHAMTPAVADYGNSVYGYYRSEGATAPVLETGARLSWTEQDQGGWGWHLSRALWQKIYSIPYTNGVGPARPQSAEGPWQTVNVTDNTAFTVGNPTNTPGPPETSFTRDLTLEFKNASGGVIPGIPFAAGYKPTNGSTLAAPANNLAKNITFQWNGVMWVEMMRSFNDYIPGW